MTATLRSFSLGVLAVLPTLPVAWFLGRGERAPITSPNAACACSHQFDRMSELLNELSSALRRDSTPPASGADSPARTIVSDVGTARLQPDADLAVLVRDAVREAFASEWSLSFDDADGIRNAVLKAGKTPFDPGVMELVSATRRLLVEEASRFATDAAAIKSKYPLVMQFFNAGADGESVQMSTSERNAYINEFDAYSKENNPRAMKHEKDRKAILKDFSEALSSR